MRVPADGRRFRSVLWRWQRTARERERSRLTLSNDTRTTLLSIDAQLVAPTSGGIKYIKFFFA